MNIRTGSLRIDGYTNKEGAAWLDVTNALCGYALRVDFYPRWHHVVIAEKKGQMALLSMPSKRWEQDLIDDGWVIKQVLSHEDSAK